MSTGEGPVDAAGAVSGLTGAGAETADGATWTGPFGVGPAGLGAGGTGDGTVTGDVTAVVVEDRTGVGTARGDGDATAGGVVSTAGDVCRRAGADVTVDAAAGAPSVAGRFSRNLRTTGASMVEDADRTNSPRSASLARTALLSYPSSLANS